ncbi:NAD(P)/FAD-dependent oxidoreductase [Aidingimonas lacisalsi]|uniref:NAD(P)/FAD-dependent oxidoreductase n=1 Tax=Aidingimonas lacisalsi TaxID=2604086 RepID=UPI0011D25B41|nr:FAD-dependent oxidoreductase [Aidingimonas lacisalsi]
MTSQTTSQNDHLVIVGNGMAGQRLLEALLAKPGRPKHITVIGEEQAHAYNRILLSPWLAGEMDREALTLRNTDWYHEHGVKLVLGERVETIDRETQRLTTDTGRELTYDRLVLATGSRPTLPPVDGIDLEGVLGFRDIEDAETLIHLSESLDTGAPAVVIGGGLLGLEAAEGLRKRGMSVSVVQRSERLMNRQLDATAAHLLEAELIKRGLSVVTGSRLASLTDDDNGHVNGCRLEDGRFLPARCVVIAAGITPNSELGQATGLATRRAIVVDDYLTTSDPAIHALGECCEFQGQTYGLVDPIWHQVDVLAARLAHEVVDGYVDVPTATKLKVSGVSLYAFGPIEADDEHDVLTYHDPQQGEYRRLLLRNNRIEGAVLYGDTTAGPWYFEQSMAERDLGNCRQALLFGPADATPLLAASHDEHDTPAYQEAA